MVFWQFSFVFYFLSLFTLAEKFAENLFKCCSELPGKEAVDNWIDRRVAVSKPKEN